MRFWHTCLHTCFLALVARSMGVSFETSRQDRYHWSRLPLFSFLSVVLFVRNRKRCGPTEAGSSNTRRANREHTDASCASAPGNSPSRFPPGHGRRSPGGACNGPLFMPAVAAPRGGAASWATCYPIGRSIVSCEHQQGLLHIVLRTSQHLGPLVKLVVAQHTAVYPAVGE